MRWTRSLLERLNSPDPNDGRVYSDQIEILVDSIRNALIRMFNSRHGGSQTAPDYGISNVSDVCQGYASIHRLENDIRKSIEKYEPRLQNTVVHFVPRKDSPFSFHFRITSELKLDGAATSAVFHSVVRNTGEVTIEKR